MSNTVYAVQFPYFATNVIAMIILEFYYSFMLCRESITVDNKKYKVTCNVLRNN
jgi:hypothetical protein